jgi:hypothetical protein
MPVPRDLAGGATPPLGSGKDMTDGGRLADVSDDQRHRAWVLALRVGSDMADTPHRGTWRRVTMLVRHSPQQPQGRA